MGSPAEMNHTADGPDREKENILLNGIIRCKLRNGVTSE